MRLVIADDETLLREGLARLLEDAGFEIAGRCGDADALLQRVEARRPDVAIVDIRMPPNQLDDGLRAAREIRRRHPAIGVLVLSHHLDSRYGMRLLEDVPERAGYDPEGDETFPVTSAAPIPNARLRSRNPTLPSRKAATHTGNAMAFALGCDSTVPE